MSNEGRAVRMLPEQREESTRQVVRPILDSVNPEKWYSIKEVAGLLGLSRDTVIRQVRKGLLKAFVLPGRSPVRRRVYESRRIQGSEILRYVREHTV